MKFGWEEVHEVAEEMEHLKSEKFFDRMDELLGSPTMDPHGSPIPGKDGEIVTNDYNPLSTYSIGDQVVLRAVSDNTDALLDMLNEKEIKLGVNIHITNIEAFDKSMTLDYGNHCGVTFSYEVCRRLMVEK